MIPVIKDDIWNYLPKGWTVVIPTNGYVNKNGEAVMGRGVALQAKSFFKGLQFALGKLIKDQGNTVNYFKRQNLITFPVKNDWKDNADIEIIKDSCQKLLVLMNKLNLKVVMPKVGCGNGKLQWEEVSPLLEKYFSEYLDDRLLIIDNNQGDAKTYYKENPENKQGDPEEGDKEYIVDFKKERGYTYEDILKGKHLED